MLMSPSGSSLERDKSTGSSSNIDNAISNTEQSPAKTTTWSSYGKSSGNVTKVYKPVTFSPLSSASTSLQSSSAGTPVKSSHASWSSPPTSLPSSTTITAKVTLNGLQSKVSNENEKNDLSTETFKGNDVSSQSVSTVPTSTVENSPQISSSVFNLKPSKISSSAVIWKPPSASDSRPRSPDASKPVSKVSTSKFEWKPVAVSNAGNNQVTPCVSDFSEAASSSVSAPCGNDTTTAVCNAKTTLVARKNKAMLPPSFIGKTKSPLPAVLDCVNLPVQKQTIPVSTPTVSPGPGSFSVKVVPPVSSENHLNSSRSLAVDLVDLHGSEDDAAASSTVQGCEPIDTTIFDKELTEDWWNSVFDNSQKDDALSAEVDEMFADEVATSGADRGVVAPPRSSTAAVLHLSSSLGGAIHNASEADRKEEAEKQSTPSPRMTARGQQNRLSDDIIQEWRAGFSNGVKTSDQKFHHSHLKENFKDHRPESVPRINPTNKRPGKLDRTDEASGETDAGNPEMKERPKDFSASFSGPIPVKFEGIGPTDEKTGVPIATRVSIDEENRKDWYRRMYASLNKPQRRSNSRRSTVNGTEARSPTPPETDQLSYYAPHAKYKSQRYRNQPLSIEDYEPGHHSSIALKDKKSDRSRVFESDAEVDYRNGDLELDVTRGERSDHHENSETGESRKRGVLSGTRSKSFNRKQFDEESRQRKQEIEVIVAEERRRRFLEEQKQNEARRHADSYSLVQKKSVLLDRFSDYEIGGTSVQRPKQIKAVKLRGKAKALYPFKAQNNTELSFKKGDIIYLLRKIDKNWYRGEHNGIVGIVPVAYVEVITSLEEAQTMALQREGKAVAKFDFKPKTSAELALQKGISVTLIRRVDQNWYEGRIGNQRGIFPIAFVETIQEPDTPLITPSPSVAPTPLPELSIPLSPTGSFHSGGPEVPSAPVSPWNSDFYESEFEPELREINSKSRTRPRNRNRNNSESLTLGGKLASYETHWKPGSYFTLPAMTKSSNATSVPSESQKKFPPQRDLFELASRRRANTENSLAAESTSLAKSVEEISKPRILVSLEKSLSFDLGNEKRKPLKEVDSTSSRYLVLYDYKPKNADELELKEGEHVRVLEKCEDGWYVGFSEANDESGTFPGNYVQLVS